MKKCCYCEGKKYITILTGDFWNDKKTVLCPICEGKEEVIYNKKTYKKINQLDKQIEEVGFSRPANKKEIEQL